MTTTTDDARFLALLEVAKAAGATRLRVGDVEIELAPIFVECPDCARRERVEALDAAPVVVPRAGWQDKLDHRHAHTGMRPPDLAALRARADAEPHG